MVTTSYIGLFCVISAYLLPCKTQDFRAISTDGLCSGDMVASHSVQGVGGLVSHHYVMTHLNLFFTISLLTLIFQSSSQDVTMAGVLPVGSSLDVEDIVAFHCPSICWPAARGNFQ